MPRGVKGSGRPKTMKAAKVTTEIAAEPLASPLAAYAPVDVTTTDKPRKPYPSADERITMADQQIKRLTALRFSRETLVAKTEAILTERQKALASCTTALEKAVAKKERLIAAQSKPPKAPKEKLTPEERKARMAAGRAAKKAENEKYAALVAALKDSGKSVDELLAELKG